MNGCSPSAPAGASRVAVAGLLALAILGGATELRASTALPQADAGTAPGATAAVPDVDLTGPLLYQIMAAELPKTYFYDTGLACYLLGIRTPDQLERHPLRGAIFENYVVCEVLKASLNAGRRPRMSFFRDHQGHEVELLVERGDSVAAVEIKSGQTISSDFFDDLAWLARQDLGPRRLPLTPVLVYAGQERQSRTQALVVPWFAVHESPW